MSVLSAQSIKRLCMPAGHPDRVYTFFGKNTTLIENLMFALSSDTQLIEPFTERGLSSGKSYGLSACTYDFRIDQDITLAPIPIDELRAHLLEPSREFRPRPWAALVSTIEKVNIPVNICGTPLDKSTYARVFTSAFNTHFDPGFRGYPTIELVNLGFEEVVYRRGDPVCQFKFEWLDEPTDLPYAGKYNDQERGPQGARLENAP